jgi:hypothetical protein
MPLIKREIDKQIRQYEIEIKSIGVILPLNANDKLMFLHKFSSMIQEKLKLQLDGKYASIKKKDQETLKINEQTYELILDKQTNGAKKVHSIKTHLNKMYSESESIEIDQIFTDESVKEAMDNTVSIYLMQNDSMEPFKVLLIGNMDRLKEPPLGTIT